MKRRKIVVRLSTRNSTFNNDILTGNISLGEGDYDGFNEEFQFTYPETNIEFKVTQGAGGKPHICIIQIYGISRETYNQIEVNRTLADEIGFVEKRIGKIYYGYDNELEEVFYGNISKTTYEVKAGESIMTIQLDHQLDVFEKQVKALSTEFELNLGSFLNIVEGVFTNFTFFIESNVDRNLKIPKISKVSSIEDILKEVLPSNIGYNIYKSVINIYNIGERSAGIVVDISEDRGLINKPKLTSMQKTVDIRTVLIPEIREGVYVVIPYELGSEMFYNDDGETVLEVLSDWSSEFSRGIGYTKAKCRILDKKIIY